MRSASSAERVVGSPVLDNLLHVLPSQAVASEIHDLSLLQRSPACPRPPRVCLGGGQVTKQSSSHLVDISRAQLAKPYAKYTEHSQESPL